MNTQEAKKLEQKVLQTLKNQPLNTVILGLSGGPDSMFLLHMLTKLPVKIVGAHINHLLRGVESEKNEQFIKAIEGELTIEITKKDITKLSKANKTGIEETGRNIRYEFFEKMAKKYKSDTIITGHHADDNLETVLFNLARGATLKGLTGIDPVTTTKKGTTLFRPLLQVTKTEILAYLKLKKIKFCIDKTNTDTKYKRNLIRAKVIPSLMEVNPNIAKTTAKNAQNLREIDDFLTEMAEQHTQKLPLDAKVFRKQPLALKKAIIHSLYKKNLKDLTKLKAVNVEEVIALIDQNVGNKKKNLGGITISIKNNEIFLSK